jgi:hypothetical protein
MGSNKLVALQELTHLCLEEESLTVAGLAFVANLARLEQLGVRDNAGHGRGCGEIECRAAGSEGDPVVGGATVLPWEGPRLHIQMAAWTEILLPCPNGGPEKTDDERAAAGSKVGAGIVAPINPVNLARPFAKIMIQEPSKELAELSAIVAELLTVLEAGSPGRP